MLNKLGATHLVSWILGKENIPYAGQKNVVIRQKIASQYNRLRISELDAITVALNNARVRFRIIKGMAAQFHLYQSENIVRPMVDIDVLVDKSDFRDAVKNLEILGFTCTADETTLSSGVVNQVSLTKQLGSARCHIDLHQLFHNWPLLTALPVECLNQNYIAAEFTPPHINKNQAIVWEFGNRAKDFYEGDMRSLIDLRMYLHSISQAEFDELVALINRLNMRNTAAITVFQLEHWIGKTDAVSAKREIAIINNASQLMRPALKWFGSRTKIKTEATPQFWVYLKLHAGFWPDPRLLMCAAMALVAYGAFKLKHFVIKPFTR